jgi:hypothetical protein
MVKETIKSNEKQYSLSQSQSNLIVFTQQHQQAIIAALLSSMAYEAGYNVTEYTQFELSNDYRTLKVTELPKSDLNTPVVKAQ